MISNELKVGDKVLVTIIQSAYSFVELGKPKTFMVVDKTNFFFNLKRFGERKLFHCNDWEKSHGLFDLGKMIIKIELKPKNWFVKMCGL